MKLNTLLKWRLNALLALRELPADGPEYRRRVKSVCADATQACAAEIQAAAPGSPLCPLRRTRKFWATLGYAAIILFLATVAAFVLSYWLVSDHRLPWLTTRTLHAELAAVAVEIVLMLLCAQRVTALQNRRIQEAIDDVLRAFDALPAEEADFIARTLRQPPDPDGRCGCCACGALFRFSETEGADPSDEKCPFCGEAYHLVFEAPEAPLTEESLGRLRSFLEE